MLLANFNGKEHLRHRAVSLRQHGFLVVYVVRFTATINWHYSVTCKLQSEYLYNVMLWCMESYDHTCTMRVKLGRITFMYCIFLPFGCVAGIFHVAHERINKDCGTV